MKATAIRKIQDRNFCARWILKLAKLLGKFRKWDRKKLTIPGFFQPQVA